MEEICKSLLPALLCPLHPHLGVISTPHLVSATIATLRALSYLQTPSLPTAVSEHLCYSSAHMQNSAPVPPDLCPEPCPSPGFPASLLRTPSSTHPLRQILRTHPPFLSPTGREFCHLTPVVPTNHVPTSPPQLPFLRAQTQHPSPCGASGLSVYPTARDFFFQKNL